MAARPRRRETDRGAVGFLRAYWDRLWLVVVTVVLGVLVVSYHHDQQDTNRTAEQACERTREIAPYLYRAYAKYHILSPHALTRYRETIPESCLT